MSKEKYPQYILVFDWVIAVVKKYLKSDGMYWVLRLFRLNLDENLCRCQGLSPRSKSRIGWKLRGIVLNGIICLGGQTLDLCTDNPCRAGSTKNQDNQSVHYRWTLVNIIRNWYYTVMMLWYYSFVFISPIKRDRSLIWIFHSRIQIKSSVTLRTLPDRRQAGLPLEQSPVRAGQAGGDHLQRLSPSIHKFDDVFIYSIRPELMAEGGTKCWVSPSVWALGRRQ